MFTVDVKQQYNKCLRGGVKTLDLQSIKYGSCGRISVLMDCVRLALTAFFYFWCIKIQYLAFYYFWCIKIQYLISKNSLDYDFFHQIL